MRIPGLNAGATLYASPNLYFVDPRLAPPQLADDVVPLATRCNSTAMASCLIEAEGRFGACALACDAACGPQERYPNPPRTAVCSACRRQSPDCAFTRDEERARCRRDYGCAGGLVCSPDVQTGRSEHCCPLNTVACGGRCRDPRCPPPQRFDPANCDCRCPPTYCAPPTVLDPTSCRCVCPTPCPSWMIQDEVTCTCGCVPGTVDCGTSCAVLAVDRNHCGACGNACGPAEACCNGQCVALTEDPNCGRCGLECGPRGLTCCKRPGASKGTCTNTKSDVNHCGTCGHACKTGFVCRSGTCVCAPGTVACGLGCCPAGQSCCGAPGAQRCRDLHSDRNNCGACGRVCPPGAECCDGVCRDTSTDAAHCGACGNACSNLEVCVNGSCACAPGLEPCDGTCCPAGQRCCSGRCVDPANDSDHCGDCGRRCASHRVCVAGVCVCRPGRTECSGDCVDVRSDRNHCGACGTTCGPSSWCDPSGQTCTPVDVRCVNGSCVCPNGWVKCSNTSCCHPNFPVCTNLTQQTQWGPRRMCCPAGTVGAVSWGTGNPTCCDPRNAVAFSDGRTVCY